MTNNEVKEQILFSYWSNLLLIKSMTEESFEEIKQESRENIIEIMRKGISDIDPKTNENSIRHALNVQEIKEMLKSEYDSDKSVQNIYFHINKLLEIGIIEEVTILKKGKHNITYFGRTAKLFLFNNKSDEHWKKLSKKFSSILESVINKIQEKDFSKEIQEILTEKIKLNKEKMDLIDQWIEKNSGILMDLDTDIKMLYELIVDFSQNSEPVIKLNEKLLTLLNFNNK